MSTKASSAANAAPAAPQGLRGCGIYIFDGDGRLLMMQRGPACRHEQYKWEVPGGACDPGESFEDAVRREVIEEIGVQVEITGVLADYPAVVDSNSDSWEARVFRGRLAAGERPVIQEPTKCVGFGWFKPEEAVRLAYADYIGKDFRALGWL